LKPNKVKNPSELEERVERTKTEIERFYGMLNDQLANTVNEQRKEIEFLRGTVSKLTDKVLGITNKQVTQTPEDIDPIGKGYIPLRTRIGEAEAQSLKESIEAMEKKDASEVS
jgi:hypothetical protein